MTHINQALALFLTLPLEERKTAQSVYWNSRWQMFPVSCRAETGEFVKGKADGEEGLRAAEERQDRYLVTAAGL